MVLEPNDLYGFTLTATVPTAGHRLQLSAIGELPPNVVLFTPGNPGIRSVIGNAGEPVQIRGVVAPSEGQQDTVSFVIIAATDLDTGAASVFYLQLYVKAPPGAVPKAAITLTLPEGTTAKPAPGSGGKATAGLYFTSNRALTPSEVTISVIRNGTFLVLPYNPSPDAPNITRLDVDDLGNPSTDTPTYGATHLFRDDDEPGIYRFQIETPTGVSNVASFYLGTPAQILAPVVDRARDAQNSASIDDRVDTLEELSGPSVTTATPSDQIQFDNGQVGNIVPGQNGVRLAVDPYRFVIPNSSGIVQGVGGSGGPLIQTDAKGSILTKGGAGILTKGGAGILTKGGAGILTKGGAGILAKGGANLVGPGSSGNIVSGSALSAAATVAPSGLADTPEGAVQDAQLYAHYLLWHQLLLEDAGQAIGDIRQRGDLAADALDAALVLLTDGFDGLTEDQLTLLLRASNVIFLQVAPATPGGIIAPGSRIVLTTASGASLANGTATAPDGQTLPITLGGSVATIGGDIPEPAQPGALTIPLPLYGSALGLVSASPGSVVAQLPDFMTIGETQFIVFTTADGRLAFGAVTAQPSTGTLQFGSPVYAISESGGSAQVTVTRTGGSTGVVGVLVTRSDGTATAGLDYDATPSVVFFADGETGSRVVTVAIVADNEADDSETVNLTITGTIQGGVLGPQSTTVLTIYDRAAGVVAMPVGRPITTEFGHQFRFAVQLLSAPTVNVTIAVQNSNPAEGTVSTGLLTFTPDNALVPQFVTVTGVDDLLADANQNYFISLDPAVSDDANYTGQTADTSPISLVNVGVVTAKTASFVDADGDKYTIKLTGPGKLAILPDGQGGIDTIFVQGTNPATSVLTLALTKALTGNGQMRLGGIEGSGLFAITMPAANLTGAGIKLSGPLGSVKVRDILNGASISAGGTPAKTTSITARDIGAGTAITLGSTISSLTAVRFGAGSVTAPALTLLTIKGAPLNKVNGVLTPIPGDFLASLTLTGTGNPLKPTALGSASIAGSVNGSTWQVAGNSGLVTVKRTVTAWRLTVHGKLARLALADVASATVVVDKAIGSITLTGPVGITASRWSAGSVEAASLALLSVAGNPTNTVNGVLTPIPGDFHADLILAGTGNPLQPTALTKANVAGSITGSAWRVTGKAGTVTVKGTVTGWDLRIQGVTGLTLGNVASAVVQAGGRISTLTAKRWLAGSLSAVSIGVLTVNGDLGANVTLTGAGLAAGTATLNTATVLGSVTGSTIAIAGLVTAFTAGSFLHSRLFVGFVPTDLLDPMQGGTFTAGSKISTFKVTGAFADSIVAAPVVGTVTLNSAQTNNGGTRFGVLADVSIGGVTVKTLGFTFNKGLPTPQGIEDFEVVIL